MANKIKIRRGNRVGMPVLNEGELGFAKDTRELFIGAKDGSDLFNFLINKPQDDVLLQKKITNLNESVESGWFEGTATGVPPFMTSTDQGILLTHYIFDKADYDVYYITQVAYKGFKNNYNEKIAFAFRTGKREFGISSYTYYWSDWFVPVSAGEMQTHGTNIVTKTGSFTLDISLINSTVKCNNSSNATITIPNNSSVAFPVGIEIDVIRYNSGEVTLKGATGVSLKSYNDYKLIDEQFRAVTLKKMAANEWVIIGGVKEE